MSLANKDRPIAMGELFNKFMGYVHYLTPSRISRNISAAAYCQGKVYLFN